MVSKIFWGVLIHFLNDYWYAKIRYWLVMDKWGDFENPVLFTEKIQYIKLYERTELRKMVADRLRVRDYVEAKVGKEPLIPILGTYESLQKEDFETLPDQFVFKANHGCGMVRIVTDKSLVSFSELAALTETWKNTDYYKVGHEWVYKDLSREIIAEKLITNSKGDIPKDWKFFCFNGKVKIIQEDRDRYGDKPHTRNLYDRNFNRLDAHLLYPSSPVEIQRPMMLNTAIQMAEILAEDFDFMRVDLYLLDDKVYFGEMTNYPGNGFIPFVPRKMEYKVGDMLHLNM